MEKRELTCIGCPLGCQITVETGNGQIINITGNTCPRGKAYAEKEVTNPTRIVTSTVPVDGGERSFISVKTASAIPKSMIFDVMKEINRARACAPVKIGDVIIGNVCGTGVDVIATKETGEKETENRPLSLFKKTII